jgi:L-iditol 2-dehydrogenase
MQALLLPRYGHLEIIDMPVPEVAADEILVRVRACGICGSDVHGLDGSTGRRIPPLVMGHEAAGEVAAIGAGVSDLQPGERVTFDSTIYCGRCYFCLRGEVNLCDNREVLGVSPGSYRRHGAFAEFVAVPRRIVYRLPDTLSFEQAALIEAVSVAVHAAGLSGVRLGDTAVVVGAGMIGLLVAPPKPFWRERAPWRGYWRGLAAAAPTWRSSASEPRLPFTRPSPAFAKAAR